MNMIYACILAGLSSCAPAPSCMVVAIGGCDADGVCAVRLQAGDVMKMRYPVMGLNPGRCSDLEVKP